jgi:hypothetical protein
MAADRPRLVCMPAWDGEFATHVEAVLAASPDLETPSALEALVRPSYPAVRIRQSELSGLRTPTWYVYRDGRFPWPS